MVERNWQKWFSQFFRFSRPTFVKVLDFKQKFHIQGNLILFDFAEFPVEKLQTCVINESFL